MGWYIQDVGQLINPGALGIRTLLPSANGVRLKKKIDRLFFLYITIQENP